MIAKFEKIQGGDRTNKTNRSNRSFCDKVYQYTLSYHLSTTSDQIKPYLLRLFSIFYFLSSIFTPSLALANPSSTNYQLQDYGFGAGGTNDSSSTNYTVKGITDTTNGQTQSTNYSANEGLSFGGINTPQAPTFTNSSNYYNKLKIVLNTTAIPTDATYAIAISTDNFATDTKYIQNDNTVGSSLGNEDWQDYTTWGGASGFLVIGLDSNTTYTIKVAAKSNGEQSTFGPTAQTSTSQVSISFDIDVSSSDSETAAPYNLNVGSLNLGSVTTASDKVWIDLATNADSGGIVYIYDAYAGLRSSNLNYTISSTTSNLSVASEGFGIQNSTDTESSGGPLAPQSPYNSTSENVGVVDTTIRPIYSSSSSPITGGRASFVVKVKTSSTTPASNDYVDTLTLISSATF
jgi:hypothetical protein